VSKLSLEDFADKLLEHRDFVLSSHISPDPDAVGSTCALALALEQLGKGVSLYFADPVPERVRKLVPKLNFLSAAPTGAFETLVVCDTAALKRIGPLADSVFKLAQISFNLDHHVSNIGFGSYNHVDEQAPATAVLVAELIPHLGAEITPEMANLLLAGLLDDTGGFCFSNVSPRAFECAAGLLRAGARPEIVSNELYFTLPLRVLKLRAIAIESLRVLLDGKLAWITVSKEDLEKAGAKPEDSEGLVEIARQDAGAEVAVLQREIENGWKLSLRAKDSAIDVNAVASAFGGGGHRAAAGCKLQGSALEVERAVTSEIVKELSRAA